MITTMCQLMGKIGGQFLEWYYSEYLGLPSKFGGITIKEDYFVKFRYVTTEHEVNWLSEHKVNWLSEHKVNWLSEHKINWLSEHKINWLSEHKINWLSII